MRQPYSKGPYTLHHLAYATRHGLDRPNRGVARSCLIKIGVDRCPVKLRIPKKQKNGASECPDPTPDFNGGF